MGKSGTDGARSLQVLKALLSDTIMARRKWSTSNGWPFFSGTVRRRYWGILKLGRLMFLR